VCPVTGKNRGSEGSTGNIMLKRGAPIPNWCLQSARSATTPARSS